MMKLRMIWQLLIRKYYIVFTCNKDEKYTIDVECQTKHVNALNREIEEFHEQNDAVDLTKNIIAGTIS